MFLVFLCGSPPGWSISTKSWQPNSWEKVSCKVMQDQGLVRCRMGHLWLFFLCINCHFTYLKPGLPARLWLLAQLQQQPSPSGNAYLVPLAKRGFTRWVWAKFRTFAFGKVCWVEAPHWIFVKVFHAMSQFLFPCSLVHNQIESQATPLLCLFVDRADLSFSSLSTRARSSQKREMSS